MEEITLADRRMQVFYTVAKLLSFTKAAETLHMTQPAVTFQIRQLEEHFNTRLFDRTHNRVSLTETGRAAYKYAEQIFELYAEMESSVKEVTGDLSGVLTIGASTTIAEYVLPTILGGFSSKYPEINLRLNVSNTEGIVSMVENSMIDLGVVEGPVMNKNLQVELYKVDELVLICSLDHKLAQNSSISLSDVIEFPFISREEGSGTREIILGFLEKAGLDKNNLNITMELGSPESIKRAVEARMGLSVMSRAAIEKEIALKTLTCVSFEPKLQRDFSFVRQRQKFHMGAMEELLAYAKGH